MAMTATLHSQVTLEVTDSDGAPLIGVQLETSDGYYGVSDDKGLIPLPGTIDSQASLTLYYLGFRDRTMKRRDLKSDKVHIVMMPEDELLEEVLIVGRTNARPFDLPYTIERITAEEILASNGQNSADILSQTSNAYVQKSQMGGGSPVLRGFEANKILLVVDGVRMNNAIYRNGHLQNAITIDPGIVQQMELIYGPGSLMYGSEALGGVIHFRTKRPVLNFDEIRPVHHSMNAYVRYGSANHEKTIHADHMISGSRVGVLTSITFSDFDDLRTGSNRRDAYPDFGLRPDYVATNDGGDAAVVNDNPNIQVGTGYSQLDILQKWVFALSEDVQFELNGQFSTSSDIPRYDFLTEREGGNLKFAEWRYGPQRRLLLSPKMILAKASPVYDKAIIIGSYQRINEDRISRQFEAVSREVQEEALDVWGLTADFSKKLTRDHHLDYGLDIHYNDVRSVAFSEDIFTGATQRDILTRYPGAGSQMTTYGVYAQYRWEIIKDNLNWNNGVRFTGQETALLYARDEPFQWPEYFYNGIESTSQAFVWLTGLTFKKAPWQVKWSAGSAFRAPNVDDLAKIRVNRDEITVPNPALKPEKTNNIEIDVAYQDKGRAFGVTMYHTWLDDAIIRDFFTLPDGSDVFLSGNDTLLVTANVNASSGRIYGLSLHGEVDLFRHLNVMASVNWQRGTSRDFNEQEMPLGHIPPTFGRAHIKYAKGSLDLGLYMQYNLWKHIEDFGGSVDNPDLATPDGSPSWQVFSLRSQWQISKDWKLNLALENILDTHYRPFSSGLSAPGRHISMSLQYRFENLN